MASPGSSERADRGAPALVAGVCGVVLVLGGVLVLLGWWGESALLVQLHPGLPAMRANAAVVLVLVGLGILAGRQGWWSLAAFLAVLSAVLPAFDIIDWALGRDIGADLFLFSYPIPFFGGVRVARLVDERKTVVEPVIGIPF